jgi:hypothetical protein
MNVGDHVTVMLNGVLQTRWVARVRSDHFVIAGNPTQWRFEDEGVYWIHGQHMEDESVQALRAAHALVVGPEPLGPPIEWTWSPTGYEPKAARWRPHKRSHFTPPDRFPRGTR